MIIAHVSRAALNQTIIESMYVVQRHWDGWSYGCAPVLMIRLELELGEVGFMLIFLAKPQIFLIILLQLLQVISTNADTFCAYRQLQEAKPCCVKWYRG